MKHGRKDFLTPDQKTFIRRAYKKGVKPMHILTRLQLTAPHVKYHHVHACITLEGLARQKAVKVVEMSEEYFDVKNYFKKVATI